MKLALSCIFVGLAVPVVALAQSDQAQLVQPPGASDLNSNLARLASNPRDVDALVGAGNAALALDDPRAAAGFFARADAITSGDGRIKAGLARVMLQLQNPAEAVRLFDQAGRLGLPDAGVLVDRGLARDMVGDQAGAQRDYAVALARTPDDAELRRRYAASLGISGQIEAADKILQPLLYKSDRAAWRYRAFILAMNNRQDDARKITDQTMPADLAQAIAPYLRKMPYLTAMQKAAALHYGHFPAQIGTQIAAITPTQIVPVDAPRPKAAEPAAQAAPDKGRSTRRSRARERAEALAAAKAAKAAKKVADAPEAALAMASPQPPVPPPAASQPAPAKQGPTPSTDKSPSANSLPGRQAPSQPVAAPPSQPAERKPVFAAPAAVVQQTPAAAQAATAQPSVPTAAVTAQASGPAIVSGPAAAPPTAPDTGMGSQLNAITLAQASAPPTPAPADGAPEPAGPPAAADVSPAPAPAPVPVRQAPDARATRSLADIIRAIDVPDSERTPTVAPVDLAEVERIQAAARADKRVSAEKARATARAKAEADAKKKKEAEEKAKLAANPSRNWVQVSTGRSRSALGFTLKALRKQYLDIAGQQSWISTWGATNRLLIGPFGSFARAKSLEQSLKAAGADVFAWQSDAGEVVERFAGN
ncbi:MAG: SPOR domain-containing protein [Sphingobium sp.]